MPYCSACGNSPLRKSTLRVPPAAACAHRIGGRKYADRPTLVRPYRKPRTSVGCQRNALATDRGIGASRIGGRKYADRPTLGHPCRRPHLYVGWSTQHVGHRPQHRHTLPWRPDQASTAPPRSAGRRAPATSFSTALAAAAIPKLAVTIITAPKPPAQSSLTPSPTKLL